jgi:HEAT repeat protein
VARRAARCGDPTEASVLLGALEAAGTPQAAQALTEIVRDAAAPAFARENAIAMLGTSAGIGADGLLALSEATHSEDAALSSAALLALGAAARQEIPDAPLDPVQVLLDEVSQATTPAALALALEALGNTGDPRIAPAALAALGAAADDVRAAAVRALRFVPGPAADQAITATLAFDPAATVRRAAVMAASHRPPQPMVPALSTAAVTDLDEGVRAGAIAVLGQLAAALPEVAAVLASCAETDPSPEIAANALAFLSTAP